MKLKVLHAWHQIVWKLVMVLIFFKTVCTRKGPREGAADCSMVKIGNGKITKLINNHYSEFEVSSDVKFEEGSLVESK